MKIIGNKVGSSNYNRVVRVRPERPFRRTILALALALGVSAVSSKEMASASFPSESSVTTELTYPNSTPDSIPERSITTELSQSNTIPETVTESEGLRNEIAQHRAAQVISTFENSTTEIQYGYAENLEDGRGITAGRAGFCSGTGDMLMVIEQYTQDNPGNLLEKYLEPLRLINEKFIANDYDPIDDTTGLEGLEEDWKRVADSDEKFREAQDEVVNELYLYPAIKRAEEIGIYTAAGQLIIFDTIIQHGEGDDPDGLPAILAEAEAAFPEDATEIDKLKIILTVREKHLLDAADPDTREAWKDSVSRVDALRTLLGDGENPDLTGEMEWSVYGDTFSLDAVE